MGVVRYGHACVGIRIGDTHLLIDPFISENSSTSRINVNDVPADYILITTAQQDHTYNVESATERTNTKAILNHEIFSHYFNLGIGSSHPMDLGGAYNFPFDSIKTVPALHFSTFGDGSADGCACGFIIRTLDKTVHVADATALHFDMQLIPVRYKVDLAVLPIGGSLATDVEDAIMVSGFVKCNKMLGYHYDTNPLTKINDKDLAICSFKAKGKELILLVVEQKVLA